MLATSGMTTTTSTVPEPPVDKETDELVYAEAVELHAFFSDKGGDASEWYFVHRWRGKRELPSSEIRQASLERLYEAGRLEPYEYLDSKDRQTRGFRPCG